MLSITEKQQLLDHPRSLTCACANGVAGVLVFALLPLLVGTSVDSLGISELEAGALVSYYYGVNALIALLSMFWIRRVNWRKASATGALLMLIGLAIPIAKLNYQVLAIGMAITGAGAAIIFPLSLTMVADMTHKDRAYGIKLAPEQLIPAGLLIILTSQWVGEIGLRELLLSFTPIPLILLLFNHWMPTSGLIDSNEPNLPKSNSSNLMGILALFSLALFFLGFSGLWAFCERIAVDSQINSQTTGQLLALGLITSGIGPIIGAVISDRFGSYWPLVIGTILSCTSLLWLLGSVSSIDFALVMIVLPCCYYFCLCYFFGIIADADGNGVISGLMAFALATGAALGSAGFGYLRSVTTMDISLAVITACMVTGTIIILTIKKIISKGEN